ncbi:MAG: AMP-binding protein, partial [Gammaproteobacteria bacterium]|nr:AMP-binding protein [Gammaproteobacteria bacterium]
MAFADGDRTLRSILEYRSQTTPDAQFVVFDDLGGNVSRLSYGEFDAAVDRVANMLLGMGLKPGDRINLHLTNCLEFLYLWFGAAKIGVVIMPTNVAASVEELTYLLNHSGSRFIFTQPEHADTA